MKKEQEQNNTPSNNPLGLDMEEQEMNGLYGMVETPEEDALNKKGSL